MNAASRHQNSTHLRWAMPNASFCTMFRPRHDLVRRGAFFFAPWLRTPVQPCIRTHRTCEFNKRRKPRHLRRMAQMGIRTHRTCEFDKHCGSDVTQPRCRWGRFRLRHSGVSALCLCIRAQPCIRTQQTRATVSAGSFVICATWHNHASERSKLAK